MSEEDDEIVLQLADPPNCHCGGTWACFSPVPALLVNWE